MSGILKEREEKKGPKKNLQVFFVLGTKATGSSTAFFIAFFVVIIWTLTSPLFNYTESRQLVINTGTNIVTF